jgi:hypothetical protein
LFPARIVIDGNEGDSEESDDDQSEDSMPLDPNNPYGSFMRKHSEADARTLLLGVYHRSAEVVGQDTEVEAREHTRQYVLIQRNNARKYADCDVSEKLKSCLTLLAGQFELKGSRDPPYTMLDAKCKTYPDLLPTGLYCPTEGIVGTEAGKFCLREQTVRKSNGATKCVVTLTVLECEGNDAVLRMSKDRWSETKQLNEKTVHQLQAGISYEIETSDAPLEVAFTCSTTM